MSERREGWGSRRVAVERRCEVRGTDGEWTRAMLINVSSGGVAVRLSNGSAGLGRGMPTSVRFTPLAQNIGTDELPVFIRSVTQEGKGVVFGCRYMPERGQHYRLIADLIYANSANWQVRQSARQVNIGIIRGTVRFLGIALYQTGRGLGYLLRFGSSKVLGR